MLKQCSGLALLFAKRARPPFIHPLTREKEPDRHAQLTYRHPSRDFPGYLAAGRPSGSGVCVSPQRNFPGNTNSKAHSVLGRRVPPPASRLTGNPPPHSCRNSPSPHPFDLDSAATSRQSVSRSPISESTVANRSTVSGRPRVSRTNPQQSAVYALHRSQSARSRANLASLPGVGHPPRERTRMRWLAGCAGSNLAALGSPALDRELEPRG